MQKRPLASVAVYLGARDGTTPDFMMLAREMGAGLGACPITAIFGASSHGLMGAFAKSFLDAGKGTLKGYLPRYFLKGNQPEALGISYVLTETLAERKHKLMQDADAFLVLPGGMGTFDEVFNTLEEGLGGYIKAGRDDMFRPIFVLNHDGFFDGLKIQIEKAISCGFISPRAMTCLIFEKNAADILAHFKN
jgi:uncharacterized protein (TIGR00730 family)